MQKKKVIPHYSASKRKEILPHATVRRNPEDTTLVKEAPKGPELYDSTPKQSLEKPNSQAKGGKAGGCLGLREGE